MAKLDVIRARAALYHLLSLLLDHPVAELHHGLVSGELLSVLREHQNLLGLEQFHLPSLTTSYEEYEADYIAWFEVGERGKPRCSLQASAYIDAVETDERAEGSGQRTALFQVLLRFYHHFGLRITEHSAERVLPDHLSCELEMMSFLCFREAEAKASGGDYVSYLRAQHDFLQRHLGIWVPRLSQEMQSLPRRTKNEEVFYSAIGLLSELINLHLEQTSDSFKPSQSDNTQVLHIQDDPISKPSKSTLSRTAL